MREGPSRVRFTVSLRHQTGSFPLAWPWLHFPHFLHLGQKEKGGVNLGPLGKAHIKFPIDYPYSPPTFRFLTKMWHPNIYENGDVCISILHPPVDDPQSGELPSERWNPTQNVRTILLSVISLLNEPNTFSPANVDASVMFRKWRDSKGKDKEYAEIIRKQVSATKAEAEKDGVKVPTTLAEYCIKTKVPSNDNSSDLLYDDLYDDDIDDEDEEEEDADCYDDDDSGNEES
ncbi:ubiquitin-conjugating enzyme E2 R2 isoform 2-T2 [Hipposideros larvatus]